MGAATKKPARVRKSTKETAAASAKRAAAPRTETAPPGVIAWTRHNRAYVYGARTKHPHDLALPDAQQAWDAVRAQYLGKLHPAISEGADPAYEPLLDELRRELRAKKPPQSSSFEREQLRMRMIQGERPMTGKRLSPDECSQLFVAFWVRQFGLPFAARMIFEPFALQVGVMHQGPMSRVFVSGTTEDPLPVTSHEPLWWLALRRFVAEHGFEDARALLSDLTLDPITRCGLFDDADAAKALLLEDLQGGAAASYGSVALFASVRDPGVALRSAEAQPLNYAYGAHPYAYLLVEHLGRDAAPVLLALLARITSGADARTRIARAAVLADAARCREVCERLDGPAQRALTAALGRG